MPEPAALGIDIGGTKLVAATVAADGTVCERLRRDTPAHDAEALIAVIEAVLHELGEGLPVGVGIAGLVTHDGVVRYGPNIGIRELDLGARLSALAGRSVTVTNDASAAALGEQRAGAARGHDDVALFTLGTGVGGGLVTGGRLVLGASGFAGELGHTVVDDGGRACPCGNRGCVEAYASGTSIGLTARERLVDLTISSSLRDEPELTGREVTAAAVEGDAFARGILVEAGRWLGVAAASVVNALDPRIVLVGGGAAARTAPWMLPAAAEAMRERLVGSAWRAPPPIELAALGDDAGMVGAALLASDRAGASAVGRPRAREAGA